MYVFNVFLTPLKPYFKPHVFALIPLAPHVSSGSQGNILEGGLLLHPITHM